LLEAHPGLGIYAIGTADDRRMSPLMQSHDLRLQWHHRVENMADTYAQCDVAIGSPGISTWERACIGLPSAVFATAENQIPILRMLDQRGFCRYLGAVWEPDKPAMIRLMSDFLGETSKLQSLRENGVRAVDGQGVGRVVKAFLYEDT
jgi:spore coat polysaccharide biosynthesis predicted glycosyltransferase SpsG